MSASCGPAARTTPEKRTRNTARCCTVNAVTDVLVDASALVALLDQDDTEHDRSVETFKQIRDPLATVWPALTEAMHLLAETRRGPDGLCDMVSDGVLKLLQLERPDLARIKVLMQKYRDLPMDFADAALLRAAERDSLNRIVTFDVHFTVYRLPRRTKFTVFPQPT
jgi:predicted nucleic acid-binding protein